jgi:hypothetical protein
MALDCVTTVLYAGALAFQANTGLVGMCSATTISSTLAKNIVGVFAEGKAAGAEAAEGSKSKILVYTDPNQLYEIQSDDDTTSTITGTIGLIFPIVAAAANTGNATLVRSNSEIDGDASAVTAMNNTTNAEILQVLQVKKQIDDTATGSWRKFVVRLVPKAHMHNNNSGV